MKMNFKWTNARILSLIVLTVLTLFSAAETDSPQSPPEHQKINSNFTVGDAAKKWEENYHRMKAFAKKMVKTVLPYVQSAESGARVSSPCKRSIYGLLGALRNLEPWAVHMLDASSKGLPGILTGALTSFGSFDQCLKIKAPARRNSNQTKELFVGQYCSILARPYLPPKPKFYSINRRMEAFAAFENDTGLLGEMTRHAQLFYALPFRMGLCVPSTCSSKDVQNIISSAVRDFLDYEILQPQCEVKEFDEIKYYQIPVIVVFTLLFLLVASGTCLDSFWLRRKSLRKDTKKQKTWIQCILAFSAIRNLEVLLNPDSASEKFKVLHGIRVYSISWIVLGHTFYYLNFSMIKHLDHTIEMSKRPSFSIISNSSLIVDNFFFISGLLMTYVTLEILEKSGKKLNVLHFILHRLWRFLPIHMAFVGITLLLPWIGSGPVWHETIDPLVEECRALWWTNLLFINNLYRRTPRGCVSHSWYLAADVQIYIFSLIVLIPLTRRPKVGLFINLILVFLSALTSGLYTYFMEYPPSVIFSYSDPEQRTRMIMETYYTPYQHVGPFCIGIFIGYFLKCHKPPKKIHPVIQVFAWLAAFTVSSASLFGIYEWNAGGEIRTVGAIFYAALGRISWTLTVAWITFACTTGYGGILNSILTWKPLIPLSRLTFLQYMVHPLIQIVFYANVREGYQAQLYPGVFISISMLVVGYASSVGLSLFLESPFLCLGKIIFLRHNSVPESSIPPPEKCHTNGSSLPMMLQKDPRQINDFPSQVELITSPTHSAQNNSLSKASFDNETFVCHL